MIVGGASLDFKAPQNDIEFKIKEFPTDSYDSANKLYVDRKLTKWSGISPISDTYYSLYFGPSNFYRIFYYNTSTRIGM
jgi:hypothetical protein